MYDFELFLIMLMAMLFIIHFQNKKVLKKQTYKSTPIVENQEQRNRPFRSIEKTINRRAHFRVSLSHHECNVEVIYFENKQPQALKNKKFIGYIEDISLGGFKLLCPNRLPINQVISIKISTKLKGKEFIILGNILRKEEHIENEISSYGVQIIRMDEEKRKRLYQALNSIQAERRKKQVSPELLY
jgi:c-di-GMP-binding flagellar brake protein YcgR